MENEKKYFGKWMGLKAAIHYKNILRNIKEGDVWWCAVGENVGVEINGKNDTFSRPVLVLKKLSQHGFLGVPLTSQKHIGNWYVCFNFRGKEQFAALAQVRVFSVSRLYERMGMVTDSDLEIVKIGFRELYF